MRAPPVVLSVAGFDPSSGAGVSADIKTIAAHGCYGIACITALTVQSTRGVQQVCPVSPALVSATLQEVTCDLPPAAVHIGMLGEGKTALAVAGYLERNRPPHVVLDPVLRSSSGADLLDDAGLTLLRTRLLACADVVTPNLNEAAVLAGMDVATGEEMKVAANRLHELGAKAVVVTGGHLGGAEVAELLSFRHQGKLRQQEIRGPRIQTRATHGTGCAFATALACNLALGKPLPEATVAAKHYVAAAMQHAYPLGSGPGPLHHLFKLDV